MIEPGRTGGYIALFSEIGFILLVTTLAGVGIGYWVDDRLDTLPVFVLVGLLTGMAVGARGVWVLIKRFLASFDAGPVPPEERQQG
jgi:F0F1-type ATP synthase assembly protein I